MIKIDQEFKSLIPPLTDEEYKGLEESIVRDGCRDPLVMWGDTLIDGHNRWEICAKHGGIPFKTIQMDFPDRDAVMLWMIDQQRGRRNLSSVDSMLLAQRKVAILAKKAREKQISTLKQNADRFVQMDKTVEPINVREEVAKDAGVSAGTVARFEYVQRRKPELIDEIRKDNMSINQAYKQTRREEKRQQWQEAIDEQVEAPKSGSYVDIFTTDKKYRVIYADPPWSYGDKQKIEGLGGAEKHYPTMAIDDICALPVPAEENAVLFLWVTSPLLEDSFKVINAWGFKYKSSFVWDKIAHNMGHYNSVRHEFLLIATRGSCTPDANKLLDSVVSIERTDHSRKPNWFRDMIDMLYPAGERLEMFAREAPEGWDVWGNMA